MDAFRMPEYLFHITLRETFPKASRNLPHSFLAVDVYRIDTGCAKEQLSDSEKVNPVQ
jgi:hypothetical protein